MKTITTNSTITARFITDSELRKQITVIERKGQFASIMIDGKIERKKVYSDNGKEYIFPYGRYSMAPIAY